MLQHVVSPAAARRAGQVATLAFLAVSVLQLLLALGILPVTMAWGGRQAVLTPALRLTSLIAAMLMPGCAYVIRRRAGLVAHARPSRAINILAWMIAVYMSLNTLGNLASLSPAERLVFAPLSMLLALTCGLVSASRVEQ